MTDEGWLILWDTEHIRRMVIDFAKAEFPTECERSEFLKTIWAKIGNLSHDEPSIDYLKKIMVSALCQHNALLKAVAEGWTQEEIAASFGVWRETISRKLAKKITKIRSHLYIQVCRGGAYGEQVRTG